MAYILTFEVDGGVLCVRATGNRELEVPKAAAKDLWMHVALECKETELSRILLLSEITGRYPTCDCYEIMSRLDVLGISRDWKIAYVNGDPELREDLSFMKAIADYNGFSIELFEEEGEARKWLVGNMAETDRNWRTYPADAT